MEKENFFNAENIKEEQKFKESIRQELEEVFFQELTESEKQEIAEEFIKQKEIDDPSIYICGEPGYGRNIYITQEEKKNL